MIFFLFPFTSLRLESAVNINFLNITGFMNQLNYLSGLGRLGNLHNHRIVALYFSPLYAVWGQLISWQCIIGATEFAGERGQIKFDCMTFFVIRSSA